MHTKNIAVVGTGYWGKNLVRNFYNLDALHTVCDTRAEVVQSFTEQYPGLSGVQSYSEVLANNALQGVVLATPAVSHAVMAKEALLAGKDVYVEKPLCLSEEEGAELIELADKLGCILMVGHLLWYHAAVIKLKGLIDAGVLGRIQYVYSNRLNLGKLRREENVLWSFAPHDISVILGLLGEMPESIQAQGGNYLHSKIADTTVTLLNFSSGVRAHIFVSWLHPFKEQKLVVVGDKKMAVFDDTAPWPEKLVLYPHSVEWAGNIPMAHKAEAEYVELEESEPLKAECQAFLDAVSSRKLPYTDGREGLNVLKVLNRCQQGLESGRMVPVEQSEPATEYQVHPTAVLDKDVFVGAGTKIWHFSHLLSGSRIGEECSIGQNVLIGPDTQVGKGCKIQNNVSVYKGVVLEDYVFCGPSVVFTNVYNPRCEFSRKTEYKQTLVKKGATLGANCTVVCGGSIGRYAFIAAGAVVTTNVLDFALVAGNPARQIGWMSRFGEQLDLPLIGDGEVTCPHTGEQYRLRDGRVSINK
ncbi:MAG: oxidoreductase [Candidatus Electrothrix sp. AR4]|nr:oxidoreductase [Candidatus Electrothrix sp. AR4]